VSLLQRQTTIDLMIESINEQNKLYYIVDLNQKWVCFNDMTSSMQWSSHHSIYQWIDSSISSRATSESASMTSILNAMIYSLSSFYSSVNLIIRSHATSESATMTSSKSISSMSKSISESASMTLSIQWFIFSSFYSSVNLIIRSHATSESASMTLLSCIVSLLQ